MPMNKSYNPYFIGNHSATKKMKIGDNMNMGYNPYFIGNHSATSERLGDEPALLKLQSLFYWKSFCNTN